MSVQHLWAKSYPNDSERYHPLWCHLLDVAAVCRALVPRFGSIADLPDEWLPYLVALHDIGKADAQFQNKVESLTKPLREGGLWFPSEPDRTYRHERRSAEWLQANLTGLGWNESAIRVIAQAVTGHHGDFQACAYGEEERKRMQWEPWLLLREELHTLVQGTLGVPPLVPALGRFPDASTAGMKLSGLIVLSDWIASNSDVFDYPKLYSPQDFGKAPDIYWTEAQKEARRAVAGLKLDGPGEHRVPVTQAFRAVWPNLGDSPRPTQAALEELLASRPAPGLLIIEAPMGEGKTEAALYAAACWNRPGVYIALPTQATSNQMHKRLSKFLGKDRVPRLVHGMAWLLDDAPENGSRTEDDDERRLSQDWFAPSKRALLAADGVGTVDQVLMAALNVKHGFLRFLGLTTKTLIIDEVHAYDLYMTTLMKMLLRWCYALDIPVILLSATLSHAQKQALAAAYAPPGASNPLPTLAAKPADEPYPLLTLVPRGSPAVPQTVEAGPPKSLLIEKHPGLLEKPKEIARLAAEAVSINDGGCVCVIANTVRSAQDIFRELRALFPDNDSTRLLLFHARFRAEQRRDIADNVEALFGKAKDDGKNENRPKRAILVATQVVEQSLDIDFDVMLSEIAPIDLLLQRSGRLHRHTVNNPRPTGEGAVLHLILPALDDIPLVFGGMEIKKQSDGWRGVYDRAALLRTVALLETRTEITLPADFRPLIEGCYDPKRLPVSSIPAEWITDAEKLRTARQAQSEAKAGINLIPDPDEEEFSYAEVRKPGTEAEDGDRINYFRLSTREGDDSRTVLVLHDADLFAKVREGGRWERETKQRENKQDWWPGKETLKMLFLQKVSLPAYWLAGVFPAEGYEWLDRNTVPKCLRHHQALLMRDRVWKGIQTADGKHQSKQEVIIIDDEKLGLCWQTGKTAE